MEEKKLLVTCKECGATATEFDEVQSYFGFTFDDEGKLTAHAKCKKCRKKEGRKTEAVQKQTVGMEWASAKAWGKRIYISKKVFESYLIDLGYLAYGQEKEGEAGKLLVTPNGAIHSATVNAPFSKKILWDEETYFAVIRERMKKGFLHDICPKCKSYLDTMPGYEALSTPHKCLCCGRVCEYWEIKGVYDR